MDKKTFKKTNLVLSPCPFSQINIDHETRDITKANMLELSPSCFDSAQHKIYMLMAKDCYPRFLRSPAYRDLVCQATPSAKATKQPRQEKKAWNLSMSRWRNVSGHLKGWEGQRDMVLGAASWSWTRLQTQRSSWEQSWMGVFCRRRLFEDKDRLKRKGKQRKGWCLKWTVVWIQVKSEQQSQVKV